jgi:hypothetical protein
MIASTEEEAKYIENALYAFNRAWGAMEQPTDLRISKTILYCS